MTKNTMTTMTVYLSVEAKRRFKALCALEGVSLGRKIEMITEEESPGRLVAAAAGDDAAFQY